MNGAATAAWGEKGAPAPKTCQEKGKGGPVFTGRPTEWLEEASKTTLLRGTLSDYSVVAATSAAAASLASLVEGGKPHLCQEVELRLRRLSVCQSSRGGEGRRRRANIAGRKEVVAGGWKNFPFTPYPDSLAFQGVLK